MRKVFWLTLALACCAFAGAGRPLGTATGRPAAAEAGKTDWVWIDTSKDDLTPKDYSTFDNAGINESFVVRAVADYLSSVAGQTVRLEAYDPSSGGYVPMGNDQPVGAGTTGNKTAYLNIPFQSEWGATVFDAMGPGGTGDPGVWVRARLMNGATVVDEHEWWLPLVWYELPIQPPPPEEDEERWKRYDPRMLDAVKAGKGYYY